jgi:hypothetical protein
VREEAEPGKRADVPECLPKSVAWQAPDLTLARAALQPRAARRRSSPTAVPAHRCPRGASRAARGEGTSRASGPRELLETLATTPDEGAGRADRQVDSTAATPRTS